MPFSDPLKMNKWNIKELIIFVFIIQIIFFVLVILDILGIHIPILRQVIGFIYITLLPGLLLLRLMKLHCIDNAESLLYAIGLSITTLMFLGFVVNSLYLYFGQYLGIPAPISLYPLSISISVFISLISIIVYTCDEGNIFSGDNCDVAINIRQIILPHNLFPFLLPIMAILGTYLVDAINVNLILLSLIVLISSIAIFVGNDMIFKTKDYPLILWTTALSLVWHRTLISPYLSVCDVVTEHFFASKVISNSFWDWTSPGLYNTVLSITILAPIYQSICDMDLTYVFKIIYPLLYSLVSLGVYLVFLHETKNAKIAFFSTFLLISISPFYGEVALIAKQDVAEIFLILIILSILNNKMNEVQRSILLIMFSFSLIVSHYGTSHLLLLSLIFIIFLYIAHYICILLLHRLAVSDNFFRISSLNAPISPLLIDFRDISNTAHRLKQLKLDISINFIALYLVMIIAWYMYVSNSYTFNTIIDLGINAINAVYTEYLNPNSSRALYLILKSDASPTHVLSKVLYMITQICIVVGLFRELFLTNSLRSSKSYLGISMFFFSMLVISIIHTGLSAMDPRRLYQLSLFTLAPFSVIGGLSIINQFYRVSMSYIGDSCIRIDPYKIISLFLAIFLLFNTGFVYEILKDYPSSPSISQDSIRRFGDVNTKALFFSGNIQTQDIYSGKWVSANRKNNSNIYIGNWVAGFPQLTIYGGLRNEDIELTMSGEGKFIKLFSNETRSIGSGYIQLTYLNLFEGIGTRWNNQLQKMIAYNFTEVSFLLRNKDRVYDNGNSTVLLKI